jgi:phage shock protein PspC (stress-responsive transcriptional regulator)
MDDVRTAFARQGLHRSTDSRILGGVVSGLGRRIGLDPWPARWLFVIILLLVPGSQLLIYPVLWILMPEQEDVRDPWTPGQPPRPASVSA